MLISSPVIAAGSGSVAGLTLSRNRGGMYLRARAVPTNPNTLAQQVVRGHLSDLVVLWGSTVTATQRAAWATYASNTPLTNALGASFFATGQQMYLRSNIGRISAGLVRADNAPTVFDLGGYTNPLIGTASAAGPTVQVLFTAADLWANEDDSAMLVYLSRPQNATVNYFKGPYKLSGLINGDAGTAPTSPATITSQFALAVGQKVFVRTVVTRADGRFSADFRAFGVVTT